MSASSPRCGLCGARLRRKEKVNGGRLCARCVKVDKAARAAKEE